MSIKVGDRVRVVRQRPGLTAKIGATGTIKTIDDISYWVHWDDTSLRNGASHGPYFKDQFELATPKVDHMQIIREMVGGR